MEEAFSSRSISSCPFRVSTAEDACKMDIRTTTLYSLVPYPPHVRKRVYMENDQQFWIFRDVWGKIGTWEKRVSGESKIVSMMFWA